MKKISGWVLVVFLIVLSGWIIWTFILNFMEASPNVKAGLLGAGGAVVAALIANYLTRKRDIASRHFDDKRKGYMHFIDLYFDILSAQKNGKNLASIDMEGRILEFKKALMVWGGHELIEMWNRYEIESDPANANDDNPQQRIFDMDKVLRAIRKDLGHRDSSLQDGELVGLMISDKENLLRD